MAQHVNRFSSNDIWPGLKYLPLQLESGGKVRLPVVGEERVGVNSVVFIHLDFRGKF